uniref:Uncharacterized protein n=1 Tax=Romanomermis culicivorax TaxID=13658 RepID=A0A915KK07_ROMCU
MDAEQGHITQNADIDGKNRWNECDKDDDFCVQIPTAFKTVRDRDDVTLTAAVGTYELKYKK